MVSNSKTLHWPTTVINVNPYFFKACEVIVWNNDSKIYVSPYDFTELSRSKGFYVLLKCPISVKIYSKSTAIALGAFTV